MTSAVATTHPDDEMLDAFVKGNLDVDARRQVASHVSNCRNCRQILEQKRTRSSAAGTVTRAARTSAARWLLGITGIAVAAVVLYLPSRGRLPRLQPDLAMLVRAGEDLTYREVRGRVSGGFSYRPLRGASRIQVTDRTRPFYPRRLTTAIDAIQQAATDQPTSVNLHLLARVQLLLGHADSAVASLTRAIAANETDADLQEAIRSTEDGRILTDVAAALLHRALDTDAAEDRLLAYEAADRAWRLAKTPESGWNRALALEALHLRDEATRAWNSYLQLDPGSSWSAEARQSIRRLSKPKSSETWAEMRARLEQAADARDIVAVQRIVSAFRQQSRMLCENELLQCWANEGAGANATSRRCLSRLVIIAAAVSANGGDRHMHETAATLLSQDEPHPQWRIYDQYLKARRAYRAGEFRAARNDFAAAARDLSRVNSPLARLAYVYLASCMYYNGDHTEALDEIRRLFLRYPDWSDYPAIRALASWIRGISNASLGRISEAIGDYEEAQRTFRAIGESENVVAMQELLASALEMIGDRDGSWKNRLAVLEILDVSSARFKQAVAGASRAARRHRFDAVSWLFTNYEVLITADRESPVFHVAALAHRARLNDVDGNEGAARADVAAALAAASGIRDEAERRFALTDPELVRARVATVIPEQRATLIEEALEAARRDRNHYRSVELLLMKASHAATIGAASSAIDALEAAIALIDRQDALLYDPALRDSLLDEYRNAYRHLITLLVDRGDTTAALVHAERSRGRTLHGAFTVQAIAGTADLTTFRRGLSPDTAVVFFAAGLDRLFVWIVSFSSIDLVQTTLPDHARGSLRTLVRGDPRRFEVAASQTGRWLVDPWLPKVQAAKTIVFVPDELTADVPFSGLRADGQMMIDRFRIVVAPSLATYTSSVRRERTLRKRGDRQLLVVGATDGRSDLNTPPLPEGSRELAFLRAGGAVVIDGGAATKRAFFSAAQSASVIHITAHAIANASDPGLSAIILQPDANDDGLLYASEIASLSLPRTWLVVISTCEAMQAGRKRREGLGSLARAFLAAGVPVVVGSTRELDDSVAADMSIAFHRRIRRGDDPVTALREVQLAMKERRPVIDWAPLQVVGGIAESEVNEDDDGHR